MLRLMTFLVGLGLLLSACTPVPSAGGPPALPPPVGTRTPSLAPPTATPPVPIRPSPGTGPRTPSVGVTPTKAPTGLAHLLARPAQALTARVEWTILAPAPTGPARTLLFPLEERLGPIEQGDCAIWQAATHTLIVYTAPPITPSLCYPAGKAIRRITRPYFEYALSWKDGAAPFTEWLADPGDSYPYTVQPDGGLAVALP